MKRFKYLQILNNTAEFLKSNELDQTSVVREFRNTAFDVGNGRIDVGNGRDRSLYVQKGRIKPLLQIIGAFKTTSSKLIHSAGFLPFQWQKSYYDRVIRDERELQNVRQYIRNNPLKKHLSDESDSPFGDPDA